LNERELLERLRRSEGYDAALLRIAEADYGCEERGERAPERVWVLLVRRDGSRLSAEVPAAAVDGPGWTEGSLCRLADLGLRP